LNPERAWRVNARLLPHIGELAPSSVPAPPWSRCGLLLEGPRLRVKDTEFERREVSVREGTGSEDRAVMRSQSFVPALRGQLARARPIPAP
jgi:hypothetical protein